MSTASQLGLCVAPVRIAEPSKDLRTRRRRPNAVATRHYAIRAESQQPQDDEGFSCGFRLARRALLTTGAMLLSGGLPLGGVNGPVLDDGSWRQVSGGNGLAHAATVLGKPVTDPRLLLRDALPVALPEELVDLDDALRAIGGVGVSKRSAAGSRSIAQSDALAEAKLSSVDTRSLAASLRKASGAVKRDAILASIPASNRNAAKSLLEELSGRLSEWEGSVARTAADPVSVVDLKNDALNISGQLQALMVTDVAVPAEYASLPQLRGRAVAEIKVKDADKPGQTHLLTMVLDGVNAPITAGNFVALARSGFYNNMPIQRADGFVVQTGMKGSSTAPIPMEVRYQGEQEPTYGYTKEELGLMRKQVVLPFNALGTVAMARNEADANSADTQFFFLNKESEVTPSGANVLDGNYAVFGYVVENQDALNQLRVDDVIESVRITYGADRFHAAGSLA